MTNEHWRKLGSIFKQIHQVPVPAGWTRPLRKATFDVTEYVRWIRTFERTHLHTRDDAGVSQRASCRLAGPSRHHSQGSKFSGKVGGIALRSLLALGEDRPLPDGEH